MAYGLVEGKLYNEGRLCRGATQIGGYVVIVQKLGEVDRPMIGQRLALNVRSRLLTARVKRSCKLLMLPGSASKNRSRVMILTPILLP